jgi:succinate dehydrogenase / fumarate reductase membrane anchor subunit
MAGKSDLKGGSLMKESWNMVVTYVTAAVLVFVLTFHLLLHSPLTGKAFDATLSFGYATGNLTYYQLIFGFLLFAAVIHGLNGIRVLAIEWLHPTRRAWLLNVIVFVLMAFFLAVGTVTLVVVG